MDDHNALRWSGPRFSNTDRVFSRLHERLVRGSGGLQSAEFRRRADWKPPLLDPTPNVRSVTERFRTPWRGGKPRFCRSRKQDFVRLRHESNGTIAPPKRKIAAIGRRSLQVETAQLR